MKTILITGALCAAIGAATGWMNAADHYEAKALKEQTAYAKALAEVNQRAERYQSISEKAGGKEWLHISVQPKNRNEQLTWDGQKYTKVSK